MTAINDPLGFARLAHALLPDDVFVSEVVLAEREPDRYAVAHARVLKLRGIAKPVPNLALIAVLDGLIERQCAVEIDWREDPLTATESLGSLLVLPTRNRLVRAIVPAIDDIESETLAEAAVAWEASLAAEACGLIWFDLGSDSYPIACLAVDEIAAIQAIAEMVGVRVSRAMP